MMRILIVANQTLGCPELEGALEPYLEIGSVEVVLVAPLAAMEGERQWDYPTIDRYIPSPEQIAHALAAGRLEHELDRLRKLGASTQGKVVDHDPVARVRELLAESQFDAMIVCTLPTRLSHWLRVDLPGRPAGSTCRADSPEPPQSRCSTSQARPDPRCSSAPRGIAPGRRPCPDRVAVSRWVLFRRCRDSPRA